jgi:hypothetical protein
VLFESPLVDSIVQPILRFFGLDWQPNHGVTPFLCALAFTYITSTIIALKQVYTGQCGTLGPLRRSCPNLLTCCVSSLLPCAVFVEVSRRGGPLYKPALDLLPFLVFLPSLMYYCAVSELALKEYPLITVRIFVIFLFAVQVS